MSLAAQEVGARSRVPQNRFQLTEPQKPLASISLDLDNLWSYMKIHGDAGWQDFPSYLDQCVEIVRDRFARHGLSVTVFIVGKDAELSKNARALRALAQEGHEIGNHSYSHEPWFHTYSRSEVEREIADAETHITRVTGQRPLGFRGPGFSVSPDALEILAWRKYLYDASTFPTFLGPLARAYYFFRTPDLSAEDREKRKRLFGQASEGLRDIRPYLWDVPCDGSLFADGIGNGAPFRLLEIPVTTMPLVRLPFHMSYLLYLSLLSKSVAKAYLATALYLCRLSSVEPSFLLHPLDFMGGDVVKGLSFFPGMNMKTEEKLGFVDEVLTTAARSFRLVTMREHASFLLGEGRLRTRVAA